MQTNPSRPRVCVVCTTPLMIHFFVKDHLHELSHMADVTVLTNLDSDLQTSSLDLPLRLESIGIQRKIDPLADLKTLFQLIRFFRRNDFDLVWAVGPKAGLIGMSASWLCGIRRRLFIFQGEVWASSKGIKRLLLKTLDRFTATFATHLLAVGQGELRFLEANGVAPVGKVEVLGEGAISGVNLEIFKQDLPLRVSVRSELGIPTDAVVAIYLGRLDPDKGLLDLAHAFLQARQRCAPLWLLIAGPDEAGMKEKLRAILGASGPSTRYSMAGFTLMPARYLNAADLFCLPSYREGFPISLLEAAALGLPSIGSDIYGVSDAIVDGQTGMLVPAKNVGKLADALAELGNNESLRQEMGAQGQKRVQQRFEHSVVLKRYVAYFHRILDI